MQIRMDIQLASIIKAMQDVIIPAVDPGNSLALEQSKLVLATLALIRLQAPLQFRFDRDELKRLTAYASELAKIDSDDPRMSECILNLRTLASTAQARLDRCNLDPSALVDTVRDIRRELGAIVAAAAADNNPQNMATVRKSIMELSREQLLRERSFALSQGYEVHPEKLPNIEVLIA